MSDPKNCPFCDADKNAVRSNTRALVILSDPRKVPGHLLVVPRRHVEKPWELTTDELQDIFALVWETEQKLIASGLGDGVDVRQNYRPFLEQSKIKVDHVHFHVIPRASEDYIYQISEKYDAELFAALDASEAKAVTRQLNGV